MPVSPAVLADFLSSRLPLPANDGSVPALYRLPPGLSPHALTTKRVVFALDVRAALAGGYAREPSDVLFLHRPFDLTPAHWENTPVLASHKGFDAHLSVGYNPALADVLELTSVDVLFRYQGDAHPIGMVGDLPDALHLWDVLRQRLESEFGGWETVARNGVTQTPRLAIMGALSPALIIQAAEKGAAAYLTGQFRVGAEQAAQNANVAVVATGHDRAEQWGLRRLAHEMQAAFPDLTTLVLGD